MLDIGVDDFGFGDADTSEHGSCATLNFFEQAYPWPERITAVGQHEGATFTARYPTIRYVQGNASELPFEDSSFDVVFSNAVIEHVGDAEAQRRFVAEALRVAPRAFITTPNRWFPVEVHTRLPLVHWLPQTIGSSCVRARAKSPGPRRTACLAPAIWRSSFRSGTRIVNLGMTLAAIVG